MKLLGSVVAVAGAAISVASFFLRTSVPTVYGDGSSTINIGLLQDQLLTFQSGCVLFLAGIVLHASGALLEASTPSAEGVLSSSARAPAFSSADVVRAGVGIVLLVAIIGWYATRPTPSDAAADAALRANVAMAVANLEMQADNMEVAADPLPAAAPSSVPIAEDPVVEDEPQIAAEEEGDVDQPPANTTDEEASATIFNRIDR